MLIGIIGAMAEEISGLVPQLENATAVTVAGLTFYKGELQQHPIIIVQSGIGKVNAALCTQILIDRFGVTAIINTGVAGGINPSVKIGDVVISDSSLHHDVDVTVFGHQPGIIPQMQTSIFSSDTKLREIAVQAGKKTIGSAKTHLGLIVSGDQFISTTEQKAYLNETFAPLCAEMEGAAIAHVTSVNQVPHVIIRIISDQADNSAPTDFNKFLEKVIPQLNQIVTYVVQNYSLCSKR